MIKIKLPCYKKGTFDKNVILEYYSVIIWFHFFKKSTCVLMAGNKCQYLNRSSKRIINKSLRLFKFPKRQIPQADFRIFLYTHVFWHVDNRFVNRFWAWGLRFNFWNLSHNFFYFMQQRICYLPACTNFHQ